MVCLPKRIELLTKAFTIPLGNVKIVDKFTYSADASFSLGNRFLHGNLSHIDYGRRLLFLRNRYNNYVALELQVEPQKKRDSTESGVGDCFRWPSGW